MIKDACLVSLVDRQAQVVDYETANHIVPAIQNNCTLDKVAIIPKNCFPIQLLSYLIGVCGTPQRCLVGNTNRAKVCIHPVWCCLLLCWLGSGLMADLNFLVLLTSPTF